jgi:biopolymer transport protein ExbD
MPLKTAPPEEPTLNLTPMIDVILTLVIFFMVGSKFAEEENALNIKVPTVSSKAAVAAAAEPKIVSVYPDGRVFLGPQPVSLDELVSQLESARAQHRKVSVLVRGDRGASHGRMTEVYDACRRAGVSEVAIAVGTGKQTR